MTSDFLRRSAGLVGLGTALLLLVPLAAMRFTDEVNWGPGDFAAAAVLLFGAGMACCVGLRLAVGRGQAVFVAAAVLSALLIVWAELAVGIFH